MDTLATINGEALAVPGLTFWGARLADVVSIICSDGRGAVELWEESLRSGGRDGGIQLHSPVPYRDRDAFQALDGCTIVPGGGTCYVDMSFVAYTNRFRVLIAQQDHAAVLRELAEWHRAHFGVQS